MLNRPVREGFMKGIQKMACTNPMLIHVIDLNYLYKMNAGLKDVYYLKNTYKRLRDLKYKISYETHKAYKIVSPQSRNTYLEGLPEYCDGTLLEVPCGSCLSCRLEYSKEWAVRCSCEASQYEYNWFITLTYDDNYLPKGKYGNPSLMKDDITEFLHKLRDHYRNNFDFVGIKYFGCGEYGDKTMRPHFHVILFNLPLGDLTEDIPTDDGCIIHKTNSMHDKYYYSKTIADLWQKGMSIVADCNYNTSAYVSRYVLKKQKGESASVYEQVLGIQAPYIFMSNGIGKDYFLKNLGKLKMDPHVYIPKRDGSLLTTKIPRYFMKLLRKIDFGAYLKLIESSQQNSIDSRTLWTNKHDGHSLNDNRVAQDARITSSMNAFHRDL